MSNLSAPPGYDPEAAGRWRGLAVFATLMVMPLGAVALVFAIRAGNAQNRGDLARAHHLTRNAKMLTIVTFSLTVVGFAYAILAPRL